MMLKYSELDWKLIAVVLILSLVGILLIMSAQYHSDSEYARSFFQRQIVWLVIAIAIFFIVIHLPLRMFDFGAYVLYGVTLLLLILVLVVGSSRAGAMRWLSFGPINLAPSDIAKLTLILALSRFFAYTKLAPASKRRLAISAILTVLPVMLILKQPDLGTSLVFWVILFMLWFWSGLSPLFMALIVSPLFSLVAASQPIAWATYLVVLLVLLLILRPGLTFGITTVVANLAFGIITPFLWGRLAEYQKLRILTFIDPSIDPRGAGYQIIQSKIAIGSGGLFGKGFQAGSQTRLEFLPERHTDFIFSVLGEEFGLFGAIIMLVLFGYLFYRAIRIADRCRSRFASNLVMGATAVILFQFLVNTGMTLGFMPVTGLALPFVSYGGTSLVLSWVLVAFMVSADYHWQEY